MRRVFISIQTTRSAPQQLMLDCVFAALHDLALAPVTVHNSQEGYDPLPEIRQRMRSCQGALIIALERFRWASGVEYPDSADAMSYIDRRNSTIWNHIEAAMAYQAGLPVLILQEQGLHSAGMLNKQLGSVMIAEFRLDDCMSGLPEAVQRSLEEWSQAVMSQPVNAPRSEQVWSSNMGNCPQS
ncbi:MAG TPA: hypothetical protein VH599_04470 [Ktedonobacterales bacterium]|jgi:hypothetical protein